MIKLISILLIYFLLSLRFSAQPSIAWVEQFGDYFDDFAYSLAKDKNQSTYFIANSFTNGFAIKIAKRDSSNLLWTYSPQIISNQNAHAYEIEADTLGNIFMLFDIGINGSIIFGEDTVTSSNGKDLVKLKDSVLIWHLNLPLSDKDYKIKATSNGNCYIMGDFSYPHIFGNDTITPSGFSDIFISKVSVTGEYLWTKTFTNYSAPDGNKAFGISLDSTETIYALYAKGYNTADGNGDSYLVKLDTNGQIINHAQITGFDINETTISSFTTSTSGNSYIVLGLNSSSTLIKGASINLSNGGGYALVIYDSLFNFLNMKVIIDYSEPSIALNVIKVNNRNQVIIGGIADFNYQTEDEFINSGLFMLKYDSIMNLSWVKNLTSFSDGVAFNMINDIEINEDCINFICNVTGSGEDVIFDNFVFSNIDWQQIFIGCLNDPLCVNTSSSITRIACGSYTSPSGNYIWNISGVYVDTIPNTCGFDSIITINLYIRNIDVSVINNSPTIISNASDASYQWLDCNNNYVEIEGETNPIFTAMVNGNYAVEVTYFGCADTSNCEMINNLSIIENELGFSARIYPNPSQGQVRIELGNQHMDVRLIIRNMTGQEIFRKEHSSVSQIDLLLHAQPGAYLVELESNKNKTFLKLILN